MRIYSRNIREYINKNYSGAKYISGKTIFFAPYELQKNYGGLNDCALVAISYAIKQKYPRKNFSDIYERVEKTAKKFLYNEKIGTNTLFINKIIGKAYNINSTGRLIKGVGFKPADIIKQIQDEKKIVILSMFSDGNDYYKNHSVSVVGYRIYEHCGKKLYFFEVRDGWNSSSSFVDYQKMSCASSINYLG